MPGVDARRQLGSPDGDLQDCVDGFSGQTRTAVPALLIGTAPPEPSEAEPGRLSALAFLASTTYGVARTLREEEEERGWLPKGRRRWPWSSSGLEEQGILMAKSEGPWTQLATRIPKELHRRLKLYCVTHDIALMHFVAAAIEEKLGRKARPRKGMP